MVYKLPFSMGGATAVAAPKKKKTATQIAQTATGTPVGTMAAKPSLTQETYDQSRPTASYPRSSSSSSSRDSERRRQEEAARVEAARVAEEQRQTMLKETQLAGGLSSGMATKDFSKMGVEEIRNIELQRTINQFTTWEGMNQMINTPGMMGAMMGTVSAGTGLESIISKIYGGADISSMQGAWKVAKTAKHTRLITSWLIKAIKPAKLAQVAAVGIIGSWMASVMIGAQQKGEAAEGPSIAIRDTVLKEAERTNTPEDWLTAIQIIEEAQNITQGGVLKDWTDFMPTAAGEAGIVKGKGGAFSLELFHQYAKDKLEMSQSGEPDIYAQARESKRLNEQAIAEDFNNQRINTEKIIQEIQLETEAYEQMIWEEGRGEREDERATTRRLDTDQRAADRRAESQFWIDHQRQLDDMERKMMEEQRKFWLEYRKLIMKMQSESGRSSLSFGLFR